MYLVTFPMGDPASCGVPSPPEDDHYPKFFKKKLPKTGKAKSDCENPSGTGCEKSEAVSMLPSGNNKEGTELVRNEHMASQAAPNLDANMVMEPPSLPDVSMGLENGATTTPLREVNSPMKQGSSKNEQMAHPSKGTPQMGSQTPTITRSQISYKSKLMGESDAALDKDFEELVSEWLKEEQALAPPLTDEQKQILDSIPKVSISDERLKELCRPWKDALIITLLGRKINLNMMRDRLAWLLKSDNFELVDLPNNYFVLRSGDMSLTRKLIFYGPWLIQGHYLAVQRWSPNFNPYSNKTRKVAIWVRIPTLPIHMYSEEFILELGNLIGTALKVDINTLAQRDNKNTEVARAKFARVSVEIDLNKKLQSRFRVRSTIYPVEYEGLNIICFKCGIYGHNQEGCPAATVSTNPPPDSMETELTLVAGAAKNEGRTIISTPGMNLEEPYGDWMQV